MRDADGPQPKPEFLWDPDNLRLVWANDDGLAFWEEPTQEDLVERYFPPESELARALAALGESEGDDASARLVFAHGQRPVWADARAAEEEGPGGRRLLRVSLSAVERPNDPATVRMRAGFEAAPRPMAIFAAAGDALARNAADRFAFPIAGDELAARFADEGEAASALAAALADGGFSRTVELKGRSGRARWRVTLRRLADPGAGGLAVLAEFVDLSLRPAIKGVAKAAQAAEPPAAPAEPPPAAAPGVRPTALAQIAHDLRAPLTAIQGFADFLKHKGGDLSVDARAAYLSDIGEASRRMLGMVDQIVALGAAADKAEEPLDIESIDLNAVAQEAARMAGTRARAAGADVDLRLAAEEARVVSDRATVMRVLDNLISNALTHGQKGVEEDGALLIAVVAPADGPPEIVVGDAGPGMSDEELEAALTPYGSDQPDGRAGGLGLSNAVRLAGVVA
ncbi:MAG: HAMP domain-containing sensor histidine kinase, partial [Pseudomonadota bacterium]